MSLFQAVPTGYVLTSGANSALTWTNAVSVSSISASTLAANVLSVSTLTTSSSVTASTITTGRLNYSSIVGSSISSQSVSSNTLTLSLTNTSTQNTQIYQVATTNPSTSYTAIQATHVSTGTTNNALVLNPSGGNVGVGTTAPATTFEVYRNGGVGGTTQMNVTSVAGTVTTTNSSIMNLRIQGAGGGLVDNAISAQYNPSGGGTYSLAFSPMGTTVMTALGSGNVGIGTTTPVYTLDVAGPLRSRGTAGVTPAGAASNIMYYWWNNAQFAFSVDGATFFYTSPSSDYRIKENIQTPGPILNRLCAVNMIDYEFKTNGIMKNDGKRIGVFAHELQEAFPEYPNIVMGKKDEVNEDGSIKIQSIAGEAIGYLVMKSVQELASQATSQAALVQELSKKLDAKSAALDSLIAWAQTQGYPASS